MDVQRGGSAALEAVDGLVDGVEETEEPMGAGALQAFEGAGADGGETDIAIALHGSFKATEQEVNRRVIEGAHAGAVENNGGALDVHGDLKVTEEEPLGFAIERGRKLPDGNGSGTKSHWLAHVNDFPGSDLICSFGGGARLPELCAGLHPGLRSRRASSASGFRMAWDKALRA